MGESPREVVNEVIAAARAMGFALAGVCEATPSGFARELHEWLEAGQHGSMDWLRETAETRLDIERFLPGARSAIVVADQYASRGDDTGEKDERATSDARESAPMTGRVARYALGRDYHKTISRRLHRLADALRERFPGAAFRTFVDSSPVFEREHALRAGLGWIGKNTLVINPALGSYLLLGGVATTLELAAEKSGEREANPARGIEAQTSNGEPTPSPLPLRGGFGSTFPADHCGQCTRCIDACPTRAITPYRVDASRCISYLTIEHEGPVEPEFHGPIGDWLLGCDICQEVCPFNRDAARSEKREERSEKGESRRGNAEARSRSARVNAAYVREDARLAARWDVFDLLNWTAEDRAERLASSAVKRATLEVLKRNALIVLGNALADLAAGAAERRAGIDRVRAIAADDREPELLRNTARQVLQRLGC